MEVNKQDKLAQEIVNHPDFVDAVAKVNVALKTTGLTFFDLYKFIDNAYCMVYLGRNPNPIFSPTSEIRRALDFINTVDGYIKLFYNEAQLSAISTGYFN